MGWTTVWPGKLRGHEYGAKKSRTPAGHGECLSRGSRRLLRIFKLIMWPIETNFKEDFFKEEVIEKYIFVFTPILCKTTFSGYRCAAVYD